MADLHGRADLLGRALAVCQAERVDSIVFLGDIIDRDDQANACADALNGWRAWGVYGNHEQQMVAALVMGADLGLRPQTIDFFETLEERIVIGDVCFVHDELDWPRQDPVESFFSRASPLDRWRYHLVFVGHTHHRAAVSASGPLDIAHNLITLDAQRRYIINPGPMVNGQFAIWDRAERVITFKQVR